MTATTPEYPYSSMQHSIVSMSGQKTSLLQPKQPVCTQRFALWCAAKRQFGQSFRHL